MKVRTCGWAGRPYKKTVSVTEFQAAGLRKHTTNLVRAGVSMPHAMALTKPSDVEKGA
jgi:hypothetical protein